MRTLLALLLTTLTATGTMAQSGCYVLGDTSLSETVFIEFYAATVAADGDAVLVGTTQEAVPGTFNEPHDVVVARIDKPTGNLLWSLALGGGDDNDFGYDIVPTSDGHFLVGGRTSSFVQLNQDYFLVKINGNTGQPIWSRSLGSYGNDELWAVAELADGRIIGAGTLNETLTTNRFVFVTELDSAQAFTQGIAYDLLGAGGADVATEMIATPDSGFIVGGYANSLGGYSGNGLALLKFEKDFSITYANNYDLPFIPRKLLLTADSSLIVAGKDPAFNQGLIAKFNLSDGSMVWARDFGSNDEIYSVAERPNGNLLLAVKTTLSGTSNSVLIEMTPTGSIVGYKYLDPGTGMYGSQFREIVRTGTDYWLVGSAISLSSSETLGLCIELNSLLNSCCLLDTNLAYTVNTLPFPSYINMTYTTNTSQYDSSGTLTANWGSLRDLCAPTSVSEALPTPSRLALYPVPATDGVNYEAPAGTHMLCLRDATGREVLRQSLPAAAGNAPLRGRLTLANLPGGLYLVQALDRNGQPTHHQRLLLQP